MLSPDPPPAESPGAADADADAHAADVDRRVYVPQMLDWHAVIKRDHTKQYCHLKRPGEPYHHLLVGGELYLDNGETKLCLNCAVRAGVVTLDRTHWRRAPTETVIRPVPDDAVGL